MIEIEKVIEILKQHSLYVSSWFNGDYCEIDYECDCGLILDGHRTKYMTGYEEWLEHIKEILSA